jgi:hypothetical protein
MLVEYLALSRLVTAVTSWPLRRVIIALGVAVVALRRSPPGCCSVPASACSGTRKAWRCLTPGCPWSWNSQARPCW